jgi:hypothetical protein
MVELSHPGSNPKFNMGVLYLRLIIRSVVVDVPIDGEAPMASV